MAIHRVAIYDEYRGMHIYDDSVNVLTNFSVFQHKLKSWLILRLSHQHNLIQAAINAAKIAPIWPPTAAIEVILPILPLSKFSVIKAGNAYAIFTAGTNTSEKA